MKSWENTYGLAVLESRDGMTKTMKIPLPPPEDIRLPLRVPAHINTAEIDLNTVAGLKMCRVYTRRTLEEFYYDNLLIDIPCWKYYEEGED